MCGAAGIDESQLMADAASSNFATAAEGLTDAIDYIVSSVTRLELRGTVGGTYMNFWTQCNNGNHLRTIMYGENALTKHTAVFYRVTIDEDEVCLISDGFWTCSFTVWCGDGGACYGDQVCNGNICSSCIELRTEMRHWTCKNVAPVSLT